jgi:hypothetical protein
MKTGGLTGVIMIIVISTRLFTSFASINIGENPNTHAPLRHTLRQNQIEMGQHDFSGLRLFVVTKMYCHVFE